MNPIPTLSGHRINKLRERVEMLERALIERETELIYRRANRGAYHGLAPDMVRHYRTLAENELIREGFVRAKEVREMEVRGNGQTAP